MDWLERVAKLRRWTNNDVRAPHTPLLLLYGLASLTGFFALGIVVQTAAWPCGRPPAASRDRTAGFGALRSVETTQYSVARPAGPRPGGYRPGRRAFRG
ncbi:hypothetical protein SAMN05216371_2318 [Streptomyces sp. TLI_053]|nr:hypothetical protein SAMN05216371_2318 [Streptomyces sp. TLI_053]